MKLAIKRTLSSSFGWRLFGPMVRAPGVIVLTYHRINGPDDRLSGLPVEVFAAQMRWLRENCDPIWPEELKERSRQSRCTRPAVLVTFDDGYRNYHDLAYPVLRDLGIPALVFLATSFVDKGGVLWTDEVQWAAQSTRRQRVRLPWTESALPVPSDGRAKLGQLLRSHLKTLPDETRLAAIQALRVELGDPPPLPRQMLTWDEVRRTMDITRYGGHSHTHPILSRLSDESVDAEIRTCKERLGAETGCIPTTFAYPNGRPVDYTPRTQEILRRHGFTIAFSTSEGIAKADSNWMAVRRLPGDAAFGIPDFAWLAAGRMRSRPE